MGRSGDLLCPPLGHPSTNGIDTYNVCRFARSGREDCQKTEISRNAENRIGAHARANDPTRPGLMLADRRQQCAWRIPCQARHLAVLSACHPLHARRIAGNCARQASAPRAAPDRGQGQAAPAISRQERRDRRRTKQAHSRGNDRERLRDHHVVSSIDRYREPEWFRDDLLLFLRAVHKLRRRDDDAIGRVRERVASC